MPLAVMFEDLTLVHGGDASHNHTVRTPFEDACRTKSVNVWWRGSPSGDAGGRTLSLIESGCYRCKVESCLAQIPLGRKLESGDAEPEPNNSLFAATIDALVCAFTRICASVRPSSRVHRIKAAALTTQSVYKQTNRHQCDNRDSAAACSPTQHSARSEQQNSG